MWCWHRWEEWRDYEEVRMYLQYGQYGVTLADSYYTITKQRRYCVKCLKRQIRSA